MKIHQIIQESSQYHNQILDIYGNTSHLDIIRKRFEPNMPQKLKDHNLFKGMHYGTELPSVFITDTVKSPPRKSRNTRNHYTVFMSQHPSWQAYPPREKSIICTNNYNLASGFGGVYAVIPAVDCQCRYGIVGHSDLWHTAAHGLLYWQEVVDQLEALAEDFIKDDSQRKWGAETLDDLKQYVTRIEQGIIAARKANPEAWQDWDAIERQIGSSMSNAMVQSGAWVDGEPKPGFLWRTVEWLWSPEAGQFDVTDSISEVPPSTSFRDAREVWAYGEFLMVWNEDYSILMDKLKDQGPDTRPTPTERWLRNHRD